MIWLATWLSYCYCTAVTLIQSCNQALLYTNLLSINVKEQSSKDHYSRTSCWAVYPTPPILFPYFAIGFNLIHTSRLNLVKKIERFYVVWMLQTQDKFNNKLNYDNKSIQYRLHHCENNWSSWIPRTKITFKFTMLEKSYMYYVIYLRLSW